MTENKRFPIHEERKFVNPKEFSLITEFYRPGSDKYFELINEGRKEFLSGKYTPKNSAEKEIFESDIGRFGEYEGQKVPLDFPMIEESVEMDDLLTEAEYQGKKVELGKPKRGGSKKFYVYVMGKNGKVKKVSFGDKNMSIKVATPERRKSFVARHKCTQKNDRTTPGYWSCRIGRYPHLTGAKQKFTWW